MVVVGLWFIILFNNHTIFKHWYSDKILLKQGVLTILKEKVLSRRSFPGISGVFGDFFKPNISDFYFYLRFPGTFATQNIGGIQKCFLLQAQQLASCSIRNQDVYELRR